MNLRDLEAIDLKRYRAMERGDVEALDAMLSDRLVYLHSTTVIDDEASYLGNMRSGFARYISCETEALRRGTHSDDVMWLLDRVRMVGEFGGARMKLDNLITATWGRDGSDWRLLAVQSTPVRNGVVGLAQKETADG